MINSIPLILCVGNPFDGFQYFGVFTTSEQAEEYGNTNFQNETWWITELQAPEGVE